MRIDRLKHKKGGDFSSLRGSASRAAPTTVSFGERLETAHRKAVLSDLEKSMSQLDEQADTLRHAPSPEALHAFKTTVKTILTQVLNDAYAVEEIRSFGRLGRQKVQLLVKVIDEHLDALARLVLAKAQDTFRIQYHVDEIKGLLLDALR